MTNLSPEPPNDFASWVSDVLQEDRLGKQLAAIDLIQFRSLRALRDRLVAVIEAFLEQTLGGIPLQIARRYSGILTHTVEGTAFRIKQLLSSPEYARKLGENGREHVRTNFLLTRHLREYLLLFLFLEHKKERLVYLD